MSDWVRQNRVAWDVASRKYVEESEELLRAHRLRRSLLPVEVSMLRSDLERRPVVVHLQSGNGLDDLDLSDAGAAHVVGVDFSRTAATAAASRSASVGAAASYVVGEVPSTPLRSACADVVYSGKGALMWLPDLEAWGREVHRLLRSGGTLFVYEAHPAAPLWTRDTDVPRLSGLSYFGGTRANDTFPASAIERFGDAVTPPAVERQWTLADIVNAVVGAGLRLLHLGEYAAPFWRPTGEEAAAWRGDLPNAFSLLARR